MRNPDRLYSFYDSLREIHMENFPDWRFGQLIYNFRNWLIYVKDVDCFFPEESSMIDYFKEFAEYESEKSKYKKGENVV